MNEGVVAHEALRWVVAEGEAVDGGEIGVPSGLAGPRRSELPRRFGRLGDALRRRGMGRHHVRAIGGASARDRSAECAPLAERGEESSGAIGVVPRAGDGLDADLVGREFLLARKTGDRELRSRLDFVLSFALGEQLRIDVRKQCRCLFELGSLSGVAGGDMADFMRHDRGDFRRVLGESQKAAGDEDISRGQGESVDDQANSAW